MAGARLLGRRALGWRLASGHAKFGDCSTHKNPAAAAMLMIVPEVTADRPGLHVGTIGKRLGIPGLVGELPAYPPHAELVHAAHTSAEAQVGWIVFILRISA